MMRKIYSTAIILVLLATTAIAQGQISGKVEEKTENKPVSNIIVKIISASFEKETKTNDLGEYVFENIYSGTYTIIVSEKGYFESSTEIEYVQGETIKVETLILEKNLESKDLTLDIPVTTIDDGETENTSNNTGVASLLNASRDIYVSTSSFNFSQARFRNRGYQNNDQTLLINGISLENIFRGGQISYGDFSGLNDVLRSRSSYYGIKAVPFSYGELGNTVDIDADAMNQRKGLRVSQSFTNRTYISRTMVTYNSGILKNNMAFSVSANYRGAKEGYIPGTQQDGVSLFLSASKIWSNKFNSTLTAFGSKNKRAVSKSAIQEFYDIAGTNYYNPSWGYQNGEKRSNNLRKDFVPQIIWSNEWKPSTATQITMSASYQFGSHSSEKMDWYNSSSPDPTYYRNAPSYYSDNSIAYNELYTALSQNKNLLQLDWAKFYDANSSNIETVPTKNVTGKWARYLMYDDVQKLNNISFNTVVNHQLNEKVALSGGLMYQNHNSENYKEVADLLGADFYVNINQFAQRANPTSTTAIHNDLNNPYGIVKVGDKYGYDYIAKASNVSLWGQSLVTLNKIDFFRALKIENTTMSREGKFKNGAYENNSFGASGSKSFMNISAKGGLTYKMNGKNYLSIGVLRNSNSPMFNHIFVIPRTTNILDNDVQSMIMTSGEVSYNFRGANFKASVTGFYTTIQNETNVINFYTELTNSFGAIQLKGIDKRNMGIEIAVESKLGKGFSAKAVGNIGDYILTNRPVSTFYYDNYNQVSPKETVYFQDLHQATGPQIAGLVGLNYNSKQYWSASLNVNYFDKIYVEVSPQRRTVESVDNIPVGSDLYNKILTQERLPSAITVDAFFRKSFLISKYIKSVKARMYFDVNLSLNNILDKTDFKINGTEQLRFDFKENNPDKYPNKYTYMMGRNFAINLILRM